MENVEVSILKFLVVKTAFIHLVLLRWHALKQRLPMSNPWALWFPCQRHLNPGHPSSWTLSLTFPIPRATQPYYSLSTYLQKCPILCCATTVVTDQLFFNHVFKFRGQTSNITSDRGLLFISHFWQELFKFLDVDLYVSSVCHPQSTGNEWTKSLSNTSVALSITSRMTVFHSSLLPNSDTTPTIDQPTRVLFMPTNFHLQFHPYKPHVSHVRTASSLVEHLHCIQEELKAHLE